MKKIIDTIQVRRAAKGTKTILTNADTIITPLAADEARALGVRFETDHSRPNPLPRLKDIYPVKNIVIASDHGGFATKQMLIPYLKELGYQVRDLGPASDRACDYPEYAFKTAHAVAQGEADCGIMIDSVGIGSAMAANRVNGILAAKCNNQFEAASAREHNYANVLTLGGKLLGSEMIKSIVKTFLETPGGAERHRKRIQLILNKD